MDTATRMGSVLRAFSRRKIIAVVIGVLVVGAPVFAFDSWLNRLIDQQGQEEVDTSARRALALAESRVNQVLGTLDQLAARGVDSCEPAQVNAMRFAAFATIPVKEIAVLGAGGEAICTDLGLPTGERKVLSSEPLTGVSDYWIDVLQMPGGERAVRLRRKVAGGPKSVAALVPAVLFLPQVSSHGNPFDAYAHMVTASGAAIGGVGIRSNAPAFVANSGSDRFGFHVEIAVPRGRVLASYATIRRLSLIATGALAIILIAFVLILRRRQPDNPIAEIERGLAAGEFIPYYQPIVDIRSGQLRGAEVLMRWRKPDGSLVLPNTFIPLAESSGLIRDLTRHIMRRVCVETGHAVGSRPALKMSFNFAGHLFGDDGIVKDVRGIFAGSPIKLSQIVMEVTERDRIENFAETRQIISALQGLGVRIAIDDVGTGHSGLSYMLKLGVDIIKIDKMFVDALGSDRNSTTIIETLVELAHNMRMDVVAEGVNNFEQVTHLRELGIRSAQGYVFAPPLPGSAFLRLIEAIDPLPRVSVSPQADAA